MDDRIDSWTIIKASREALADYLGHLSDAEWQRPSLCAGWTVRDVTAHLLVVPTRSKGQVFRSFVRSRFNLDRMNARFVEDIATRPTDELIATTRSSAGSRSMPPGLKVPGVLTEIVVHSLDIAEAVGTPLTLPDEASIAVLDHLKGVQPVFGAKKRIEGLTLRATDATWSTGRGPTVEGPLTALLLAVAGRPSALDRLAGDGLATLRRR